MTVDSDEDAPWWRGAVIYQIYPRSFQDTNGDGIGDLPGIASRLDHVASLGVDGIWISPFFTSPMTDFGYDVSDYCGVDPLFGTLADFDAVLARAHGLGLKVVIDQVYSHTSDQHAWFAESRSNRGNTKADWYVWADPKADGSPPNNWQSVFGGPAWTWDARREQYYLHNFLATQPDLNLHNREVQDALLDVARFWLDRGVDGFRLDAINFGMHDRQLRDNPARPRDGRKISRPFDLQYQTRSMSQPELVEFLERLRGVLDGYPDRFTVAEVGGGEPLGEMKSFTTGEKRLNSAYGFDYLYADRLTAALVKKASLDWPDALDEGWPSWAFSNHDAPRAISRWHDGSAPATYSKMLALLLLSLRGNPIIYQGEELGLPQADIPFDRLLDPEAVMNWPKTLGRDGARTPMPWIAQDEFGGFSPAPPWLPVEARHLHLAADRQKDDPDSVLNFVRRAVALRKASPALRLGTMDVIDAPEPVFAFVRRRRGEEALCAVNLGGEPLAWRPPEAQTWDVLLQVGAKDGVGALTPFGAYVARRRKD